MDSLEETDVLLDDHINKCRCCFRLLIDDQMSTRISKSIEQKFYELTQIELIQAEILSTRICNLCNNDLEVFHNFRKDLVRKQKKLYGHTSVDHENSLHPIKSENDFVECSNDANFEDEVQKEVKDQLMMNFMDFGRREQRFDCKKCSFVGKTRRSLRNHVDKEHLRSEDYHCDRCSYTTQQKSDIEHHMRVHMLKEPKQFFCEMCGLKFNKCHLLNRHVKVKHTVKERKFKCSYENCDKAFYSASSLQKHSESHSEKKRPCEYCGKLFSCLNNLRTHLYYHSEPRFVCEFEGCDKKFYMRKLLKAHINVHRGQKDYICEFCEKSYFFQAHLKRHIISTHMRLKINCELCESTFARKETYRNHVINQHQNLEPDELERLLAKIRQMKVEDYRCSV